MTVAASRRYLAIVPVALVVVLLVIVEGARAETPCGKMSCKEDEFCSEHSASCDSCSEICTGVGYNKDDCDSKCKDYLILLRIATLEHNLFITIIIFAVILALLALTVVIGIIQWLRKHGRLSCGSLKRFIRRDEKTNPPPSMEYTHENPHTKSPKLNARNSTGSSHSGPLPLPPSVTASSATMATMNPSSVYLGMDRNLSVRTVSTSLDSQYPPSEAWNENHAYDNGGLAITPTENTYEYVGADINLKR